MPKIDIQEASAVAVSQEPSQKLASYFFFDAFSADLVVLPCEVVKGGDDDDDDDEGDGKRERMN